jgi:hypothetical protein
MAKPINKDAIEEYNRILYRAEKNIIDVLNSGTSFKRQQRAKLLQQIQEEIQRLSSANQGWFKTHIPKNYKAGAAVATAGFRSAGLPFEASFTKIDTEMIQSLVNRGIMNSNYAIAGIERTSRQVVQMAKRQRLNNIMAEGILTGEGRREVQKEVAQELRKGFVSIVDRSGRKWNAETYSEMLVRTELNQASVEGLKNRMVQNGYDLVQVSMHFGACDLCTPWEGRILSLKGATTEFRGMDVPLLSTARKEGLFHPNCRHRILPFHPDFAGKSYIWSTRNQEYVQDFALSNWRNPQMFAQWIGKQKPVFEDSDFSEEQRFAETFGEQQIDMQTNARLPSRRLLPKMEEAINRGDYEAIKNIVDQWKSWEGVSEDVAMAQQLVQTHKKYLDIFGN